MKRRALIAALALGAAGLFFVSAQVQSIPAGSATVSAVSATYNATLNTTTGAVTCSYAPVSGVIPVCLILDNSTLAGGTPLNVSFSNMPAASATSLIRLGIVFSTQRLKQVTWPTSAPACYMQEQDGSIPCGTIDNFWGMGSPLTSGAGPAQSIIFHGLTYDGTNIWPDRTEGQFQTIVASHINSTQFSVGLFSQASQSLTPGTINLIAGSTMNLTQASTINFAPIAVASLPACGTTVATGTLLVVNNALSPAYNATVAAGGAVTIPVMCNGTNWVSH
jgi:hypothetical protein